MTALRTALLLSLSLLATACGGSNDNAPSHGLPPGHLQEGQPPPSGATPAAGDTAPGSTLPALLNARDAQGRIIYRTNTGCFVDVPAPPTPPGLRPPVMAADDVIRHTQDVACPAVMANDPAWLGCQGSEIYLEQVSPARACVCMSKSLPPPPPNPVACPAAP